VNAAGETGSGPHLLRVEGVNLDSFVFDTQDLSTIRGGGLLLLAAIEEVASDDALTAISTGASVGLFRVNPGENADQVAQRVKSTLQNDLHYRHATFVIDTVQMRDNSAPSFIEAREQLVALNRFQQQCTPTVSIPDWNLNSRTYCEADMVRAATRGKLSESAYLRQEYGRTKKHELYRDQASMYLGSPNPAADMEFTNNLEDLTDGYSNESLNRKMAVIHIDGNGFSSIQKELVLQASDPESEQHEIDISLKKYRRQFLVGLLEEMKREPKSWRTAKGEYRIEFLLWGGDEIVLVVPARAGWQTASFFYECSRNWKLGEKPLKHAMGVVFCHHKAPIHRIVRLAKELTELAKVDRERNLVAYQVLETFDHAGTGLEKFRDLHSPVDSPTRLLLEGEEIGKAITGFGEVKDDVPRTKLFALVRALLNRRHGHETSERLKEHESQIATIESQIQSSLTTAHVSSFKKLEESLGGPPSSWFHLQEMWDYLAPNVMDSSRENEG
jgi:hypothetical protein